VRLRSVGVPAALVVRGRGERIGFAVDDVEDVESVDTGALRIPNGVDEGDGILVGVLRRGGDLVAVLDAAALVAACAAGRGASSSEAA